MGERRSYTIIVSPADDDGPIWAAVKEAADKIAGVFDTIGVTEWDVDVIEGTFGDPLSGDNVHGLGGKKADMRCDTCSQPVRVANGLQHGGFRHDDTTSNA